MTKHVVVLASGETELRAVPLLVAHLRENGIEVRVRIPPRNRAMSVEMAHKLIQASRYDFCRWSTGQIRHPCRC